VQSSAKVTGSGEAISSATYQAENWMQADVPTTVVAAQVKSGVLPILLWEEFAGLPGSRVSHRRQFSNIAMPPDSPYAVSWWYRKEFSLSDGFLGKTDLAGKTVWLNFRGINYRANIFLNGKRIADSDQVAGAWRTYEFNVSSAVKPGTNVLAVQVWAPTGTV